MATARVCENPTTSSNVASMPKPMDDGRSQISVSLYTRSHSHFNHKKCILCESPLKGIVLPKMKFCCNLLTLNLCQTCMNFFLLNIKEDILKNIDNQTVDG